MESRPDVSIPHLLNEAYERTDKQLASQKSIHSGCTAVSCFIRIEEREVESHHEISSFKESGSSVIEIEARKNSSGINPLFPSKENNPRVNKKRKKKLKLEKVRVLYSANAGDARAVLW